MFLITSTLENKFVIKNLIFLYITKLVIFASSCLNETEAAFLGLTNWLPSLFNELKTECLI